MRRRRGVLALWLLLAFSGLAAAAAGLVSAAAHTGRTAERYREGLAAQYAAESGAVWGLLYIKEYGLAEEHRASFPCGPGTETEVRLVRAAEEETPEEAAHWTGTVYARGLETASGVLRYTVLTVDVAEDGGRTVTVKEAGNEKW